MQLYNTLSRRKENFAPLSPPNAGIYVCGPTVYGEPHLGHARSAITFDLLFRCLLWQGYKVRYVRNITDVGHLENDSDSGDDKIAKRAALEQVEPMEIAQHYTRRYHTAMQALGCLPPSIEPLASAHIIEQIELVERILQAGYAYVSEGSVYFDVEKYNRHHNYGKLSGRTLDEMLSATRSLDGQQEKRCPYDFALWKKAAPQHIMRWKSPWSEGFPGWHLECSAMSIKYLGGLFDIHGGGMDLLFPHHECEIAQNTAAWGHQGAQVWLHNNMITINKQKMGKSLGNAVTLEELFTGAHPLLEQAYSPMTIRFFILQAHYRSPLDFGNDALQAADKGLRRLLQAKNLAAAIFNGKDALPPAPSKHSAAIAKIEQDCKEALCDDLNSPAAIACLFDAAHILNAASAAGERLSQSDAQALNTLFNDISQEVLGISEPSGGNNSDLLAGVMDIVLDLRASAKAAKDYAASDSIRNRLSAIGITINDGKEGCVWTAAD